MLDRLVGFKIHHYLQALGLFILAFGVPMNKVLMSIGTIWLAANLLLKADFKAYWERWKNNLVFWFIVVILFLHLLGLTYTHDFHYALRDLKAKLPLFVIPISLIGYPLEKRFFNSILIGFLTSLIITSSINFFHIKSGNVTDYREFSLFGSHIRYALIVIAGILTSFYFAIRHKKIWFLFIPLILWFSYYTMISQVLSGYVALFFLFFGFLIYASTQIPKNTLRITAYSIIGIAFLGVVFLVQSIITPSKMTFSFSELPTKSKYGEPYFNDTTSLWFENKHHIQSLIAEDELYEEWNKRSEKDYFEVLDNGYQLRYILMRYMASKGLSKDKEGMEEMTPQDIQNVENGIHTILKTYPPLRRKMAQLENEVYQYNVGGDPNGNSLLERFEHWKASEQIIKENWILGIGTGDVQEAFDEVYERTNSRLHHGNRNRAHNQFLTFWITFGIVGFIVFTLFWVVYLGVNIKMENLIGIGFTLIAIASFLSEDTIETQQGVTFIALFLGLSELINQYKKP